MKNFVLFCIILTSFIFARPTLQLDQERVESGKTFGLQLIIPLQELPENRSNLQLNPANGFTFLSLDSTDQVIRPDIEDMFNSFFGGRPKGYKARIYTFKLKAPKKTGNMIAGQIYMDINGEKHNLMGDVSLTVQRSFSDDALAITLTPSKRSVYEGEQFSVTLGLHIFDHYEGGLQPTDMNTGDNFISYRSDLSDLKFTPVQNSRREQEASAKYAWLAATKSGNLQIPAFKFKYTKRGEPKIVEENKQMGSATFQYRSIKQESIEAEAASAPLNITVKPLPENKPANFSGMVGSYSFKANFDKENLKVGDALTLTINIKGDGLPGSITDPKLPDFSDFRSVPPEVEITKKIQGSKVITSKNLRIFLYPKKKGVFTLPEITYSWFNPTKKKYETASAGPWNIVVEKGDAENVFAAPLASNLSNTKNSAVQKQEIEALGNDIRFIHKVEKNQSPAPYKKAWFWILLIAAIPFYFITNIVISKWRKHNSNEALLRKNKAHKMLKAKFANAQKALEIGDAKALYAALENGLTDYLSDVTNLEFKGMVRTQMREELKKRGVNLETLQAIDAWLDKCAFARYAPVNPTADEQKQMLMDVEKLCENLGNLK